MLNIGVGNLPRRQHAFRRHHEPSVCVKSCACKHHLLSSIGSSLPASLSKDGKSDEDYTGAYGLRNISKDLNEASGNILGR